MHLVPVRQIAAGMRLARPILLPDGRMFLNKGAELRETYAAPLLEQGITFVYVVNPLAPDVVVTDVVSEEARQGLTEELRGVLRQIQPAMADSARRNVNRFSAGIDVDRLQPALGKVVDELMSNCTVVVNLKDLRSTDDNTLGHSVNVCILSTLLGVVVGLNPSELRDLSMGAILHDVGKTLTPPAILTKPGRLTPEELAVMQRHTSDGWNILKGHRTIPYRVAIVALQHHERWQGGGYPEGLRGEQIFKYSRICAVADCFDAMTSDRSYRQGMTPARALAAMQSEMAGFFEPELILQFIDCVAPYPVGSLVTVTGGLQAVVVAVARGRTERPRIRLVLDGAGRPLAQPGELELIEHPEIQITGMLREGPTEIDLSAVGQ